MNHHIWWSNICGGILLELIDSSPIHQLNGKVISRKMHLDILKTWNFSKRSLSDISTWFNVPLMGAINPTFKVRKCERLCYLLQIKAVMWRWLSLTPAAVRPNMRELVSPEKFLLTMFALLSGDEWENTVHGGRKENDKITERRRCIKENNLIFLLYGHFLTYSWMWQLNSCLDVMLWAAH